MLHVQPLENEGRLGRCWPEMMKRFVARKQHI